jgi:isoleucyl-tRNA synthetase
MNTPEATQFDPKKSVNLPKTDFPMKANLPNLEPKLLSEWSADDLYGKIRAARQGRPQYVLHDGPPYANGNIHLGHALNKLLKDFIVKSRTMMNFDSPYVPGWDCHGLPIEIKVDGLLGSKRSKMTPAEIRRECRAYAAKFVDLQSKDFQRLGIFGDWANPYLTMSPEYQSVIARAFVQIFEKGLVYKGLKPVNWCINDRTALAEAETEYENHTSPSVWVKFALKSDPVTISPELSGKKVSALIWTTTPWTLPANLGISFNPHFDYVAVEHDNEIYLVAEELVGETAHNCHWQQYNVVCTFSGSKLDRAVFQHPFIDRESLGMVGDHVTLEQGTGAVHTAPGHGQDDYVIGQRYGLPTYCPVDGQGRLYAAEGAPGTIPESLLGLNVWQANPVVIEILQAQNALAGQMQLNHSYPHCWRCHKPTIFRATEQWFIGMEKNNLRQNALEAIKRVKWNPTWGEERISNMIATRPDWCISRQRTWGVPIVAFYCQDCGEVYDDTKKLHEIVDLFSQHTADYWYEKSAVEMIGSPKCKKCGCDQWRKETDILDVWFDSGSSHLAVLKPERSLPWPSQMYLEGGDQYRGWFHSSLLIGVALKGSAPYQNCATNGWTLDEQGRAMSKSLGNVIEPEKIIKQYGAEILRLWVSSVEFYEDVRLSETILTRLTEAYRKLRNTFRYALGNLSDFDPAQHQLDPEQLLEIDQWILTRTETLVTNCLRWYQELAFHKVYRAVYDFATIDLSSIYFDILKDRLYTALPQSKERRSAQTSVYLVTDALVRLMAPVLAFTCDEVWRNLPKSADAPTNVHLTLMPDPQALTAGLSAASRDRLKNWDCLLAIRDVVLKALETARQEKVIGAPLEANVVLRAPAESLALLQTYQAQLPGIFIVSSVHLESGDVLEASVTKSTAAKCERCWKYLADVGQDAVFPNLCGTCVPAALAYVEGRV